MITPKPINALIHGLSDGGCSYVTNVPGSKSQDIFFGLGGTNISSNERIAFEMVYGASIAGKRAVATFKNTGLSAASDPFIHSVLAGVNGGLVVVVIDDIEANSSPERQDSRSFIDFYGGLWLEPSSSQMAYDFCRNAFEWSEKLDIPIVIRITNQFFMLKDDYTRKEKLVGTRLLSNERKKYISYWKSRYDRLQQKNDKVLEFVKEKFLPTIKGSNTDEGVVVFGNCQRELSQAEYHGKQVMQVSSYPFAVESLLKFTHDKTSISVLEQGNPYAYRWVSSVLHAKSGVKVKSNTGDLIDASGNWPIWAQYENIFKALKSINPSFVVGDEGQFTDESTKTIDICLCMGASVGITMGMALNEVHYPFCVIGDASFLHGGIQTLGEALFRKAKMGIIVIDNGGAQSTGGQKIAGDIYDLSRKIKSKVINYSQSSKNDIASALINMRDENELAVLYVTCKSQ